MLKSGYVRIDRSITRWRWYQNANTCRLFIHLILTANYEEHQFETITVHRGQCVTSIAALAKETGMTEKEVRTALKHLKGTNEVAVESNTKYSVISIINYEQYQKGADTGADKGQTEGGQGADKGQQCKKDNKDNKEKKEKNNMPKHKYGDYKNVLLSDEDLQKLKTEFPYDWRMRIERLSEYMASTGKSYRNHLATIRAWAKKENGMDQGKKPEEPKRGPVEVLNGVIEIW